MKSVVPDRIGQHPSWRLLELGMHIILHLLNDLDLQAPAIAINLADFLRKSGLVQGRLLCSGKYGLINDHFCIKLRGPELGNELLPHEVLRRRLPRCNAKL